MKLRELREWFSKLPVEADEYDVVLGKIGKVNEQYFYRVDDSISALDVDADNNEILIMALTDETIEVPTESNDIASDK